MTVGYEWLVDAQGCRPECLADPDVLREVCGQLIAQLDLHVVGEGLWHQFPAPSPHPLLLEGGEGRVRGGGVTGLYLLTESHLTCHTYPEYGTATFNLYCCRPRPCWSWEEKLRTLLGATRVVVRSTARGEEGGRA